MQPWLTWKESLCGLWLATASTALLRPTDTFYRWTSWDLIGQVMCFTFRLCMLKTEVMTYKVKWGCTHFCMALQGGLWTRMARASSGVLLILLGQEFFVRYRHPSHVFRHNWERLWPHTLTGLSLTKLTSSFARNPKLWVHRACPPKSLTLKKSSWAKRQMCESVGVHQPSGPMLHFEWKWMFNAALAILSVHVASVVY